MHHTLFFDYPDRVSAEELLLDLDWLPSWRRERAMEYHFLIDRVLSVKAFLLLREGLQQVFNYRGDIDFDYMPSGKPRLRNRPDIHFNISHCRKGVMCVVADCEVGCDIEEIVSDGLDTSLLRHCLNEEETNGILSSRHPEMAFTRLWTVKEAVLKLFGNGIDNDLPALLTPELMKKTIITTEEQPHKGYVYSVALKA